jgi:hypothetical protein
VAAIRGFHGCRIRARPDGRASLLGEPPGMTEWIPQRGVYLYRQRLGLGNRPLTPDEPEFPWLVLPLSGLGFVLFFAGLALVGLESHVWEWLLAAAGLALLGVGAVILAGRFL